MKKILIIESEPNFKFLLTRFLTKHQYEVTGTDNAEGILPLLLGLKPQAVIYDANTQEAQSIPTFLKLREMLPHTPIIIITNTTDIKLAVSLIKLGAQDCLIKPLLPEQVLQALKEADEKTLSPATQTEIPSQKTEKEPPLEEENTDITWGKSPAMQELKREIQLVAETDYSVIIQGESGSGKEAMAREIHQRSHRKNGPFMAIDCGTLNENLSGSELFGHTKGAFTGALQDKKGLIELADGGTLFLDEIGNLSYDVQISLLRAIQERKIKQVGGIADITVNVRIVAASNENLWAASLNGVFRQDLFHRLNEFSLWVPPLRERTLDIPTLARLFLEETAVELEKKTPGFAPETEAVLLQYPWPGNLRELKNVVRRAALVAGENLILPNHLPAEILPSNTSLPFPVSSLEPTPVKTPGVFLDSVLALKSAAEKAEMDLIMRTLQKVNYNKSRAAHLLNVSRRTLYNKLKLLFKNTPYIGNMNWENSKEE